MLDSPPSSKDQPTREAITPCLTPDLVIELASPTDSIPDLLAKMLEYQDNGVRLGWLILPAQRQVHVFASGAEPRCLDHPAALTDDMLLPGLSMDLGGIWGTDF